MVVSFVYEFRGLEQFKSKKSADLFFMAHFEEDNGRPFRVFAKSGVLDSFVKGDVLSCKCELNIYSDFTRFQVVSAEKVSR